MRDSDFRLIIGLVLFVLFLWSFSCRGQNYDTISPYQYKVVPDDTTNIGLTVENVQSSYLEFNFIGDSERLININQRQDNTSYKPIYVGNLKPNDSFRIPMFGDMVLQIVLYDPCTKVAVIINQKFYSTQAKY